MGCIALFQCCKNVSVMDPKYARLLAKIENPAVQQSLQAYAEEIGQLTQSSSPLAKETILRLLLVRDAVERSVTELGNTSIEQQLVALTLLSDLDSRLQAQASILVAANQLAECCQSRQPPEEFWWWRLQADPPAPSRHRLDRLDWLWNTLSAGCLVFSASFLTITAQAFSAVGGFDLLQTLSTLSQATGLVLVAGGALTDKGQKVVQNILKKLDIPPHFHSEVTLGASALLLLGAYGVYSSLPRLAQYYYQKGLHAQRAGNQYAAIEYFQESISFDPNNSEPHTHLAEVYQNLERFQEAQIEYQDGLLKGDITALNGMGTLSLATAETEAGDVGELTGLFDAEVLFRIGLNQVEDGNERLQAILHTNLGITLMKRAKTEADASEAQQQLFTEASEHFQQAIRIQQQSETINQTYPSQGVAYCFLAGVYEQGGNSALAAGYWETCKTDAYPASLEQYEDILRLGGQSIGLQLNTKHILEAEPD